MENKIVKEDFKHINFAILAKTRELRQIPTSYDEDGQKSLVYLGRIISAHPENFVKDMDTVYQQALNENFVQTGLTTGAGRIVMLYQIIWARMIVTSYYYYHDDKKWIKKGIPLMENYIIYDVMKEAIKKGMKLVDEYYQQRADWMEDDTPKDTPQPEQRVPAFHIAENRKTDAIKVFSYMFDDDLFVNADGSPLKRQKTQFMKALGEFFGADFTNYARIINKAAQEPNFPGIFEHMLMRSKRQYVYTK